MKRLLMMLFAATLAVTAVQAQDGRKGREHKSPEEKAQLMTAKMQKNLALTDDQVAKVNEIHIEQAKKTADIRERNSRNREAARTEMKAVKDETNKQYASVLTKEQLVKKEEMHRERKEKMKERHGHKKSKNNPAKHPQKKANK